jgi:N-acyl-D-amino-acid deacylase
VDFDFFIQGGMIIDGSGNNHLIREGDVGIKGDRIKAVGNLSGATAEHFINARDMIICPGFIDTHAHSDFTLLADGRSEGKIYQGITTEINGNCGMSAAPLYGFAVEHREKELDELNIKERWNSYSEFFTLLNKKGFATNFVFLVGHGNLRSSVTGFSNRELLYKERKKMFELLRDALRSGARGLSTGLAYPPGIYSDTKEIIDLARETRKDGGFIYSTHMRDESDNLLTSLDETIKIGFDAGIHVHISHLKTNGRTNWGKITKVFEKIHNAQQQGLRITCDRYPYIATSTDLDAVLPPWVYEGGHEEALKRLQNERQRLRDAVFRLYPEETDWKSIRISSVHMHKNKWIEGKSLFDIGRYLKKPPLECLFDILIEEKLRVGAIFFSLNEDNLKSILALPYAMIGSDSSGRSFDGITAHGKPHPRGFGSFPRILGRYVREQGVLSLTEAVYKMTGLPADIFKIKHRGIIHEGFYADITVFHSDTIKDRATFESPFERPEGVPYVFVNGAPVLWEGKYTNTLPGRVLR